MSLSDLPPTPRGLVSEALEATHALDELLDDYPVDVSAANGAIERLFTALHLLEDHHAAIN